LVASNTTRGVGFDAVAKGPRNLVLDFGADTLTVQCLYPKSSKPIIDEIDRVLAARYGFTEEELDFIINYDIKYRMGRDEGLDDE